jgi:hypothetical protein
LPDAAGESPHRQRPVRRSPSNFKQNGRGIPLARTTGQPRSRMATRHADWATGAPVRGTSKLPPVQEDVMAERSAETELDRDRHAVGGIDTLLRLRRKVDMADIAAAQTADRPRQAILRGLPDLRFRPWGRRAALVAPDPDVLALALASARVYAFATADYPGAAISLVFDRDGTTAVGAFILDPTAGSSPATAFTFSGGVYQILSVPGSTASIATCINGAGSIGGVYADLAGEVHGFVLDGGVFSTVDFPGATTTQIIGLNDAGQLVGDYIDAASTEHGFVAGNGVFTPIDFPGATGTAAAGINADGDIVGIWSDATTSHGYLLQDGVFTPVDFPLSTSTSTFGINDGGEIAGFYTDAAGVTHGFVFSAGAFSIVDVTGARSTQLTRIKNDGMITGVFADGLTAQHGLLGQ